MQKNRRRKSHAWAPLKGQLQTYRAVTQRYCHKKRVTQRDRHIT
jgi:hypothetical protein